jgi:hypothetical protein
MSNTTDTAGTDETLRELLIEACPPSSEGRKSIPLLAAALGLSDWAVYKWAKGETFTAERAKQIVALDGCSVPIERFYSHVFG